jgi:hypothetical protein
MFACGMGLGMPATATTSRKAASRSSISTSTRRAPTTRNAASKGRDRRAERGESVALLAAGDRANRLLLVGEAVDGDELP